MLLFLQATLRLLHYYQTTTTGAQAGYRHASLCSQQGRRQDKKEDSFHGDGGQ
jgi:hypothetical protein